MIDDWRCIYGLGDIIQELSKCIYYNTLTFIEPETPPPLDNNNSSVSMEEE